MLPRSLFFRLGLSTGLTALALVTTASLVSAHARYDSSTPASGATLTSAPATLQVTFTEELASIKFDVTGPDGTSAVNGTAAIDLAKRKNASVPLLSAGPGQYSVVWHNVSGDDGDPNDGSFVFTVAGEAPTTTTSAQPVAVAAPATGDDAITPGIQDMRINTYRKRQAIRDQYKGKIKEVAFNEAIANGQGLESALQAAMPPAR